ncbi:FGGY-family carbohydrate kinase [Myxococcota bacterium]|nr:FGGY-family carbohydrate kinase [Myxococcota bacterium]MBU1381084.1 FGGY-family carbohydrate kinase [Myxococcota bacterium]MBU1497167.1 FGGY-family carbohydrate kinase [Myxococcota bacterium]
MQKDLIVAIDCGTQSLRTAIFDENGQIIDIEQIFYSPYESPFPGWAEQDPLVYWDALCKSTGAICERNSKIKERFCGVTVTTLRDSVINLDNNGLPLRKAILWMDKRKAQPPYNPGIFLHTGMKIIGMDEVLRKVQVDGKCNWIMQNEPDIWKKTHKFLLVSGYLNFCLTGQYCDSVASQIGHIPFNYKNLRWSKNGERNHGMFPVDENMLCALVSPGERCGEITHEVSVKTGLPSGLPVIASGSDKGCETLGSGVFDSKSAAMSFGTTATCQTLTDRYTEIQRFMPSYPAVIPGKYNPEVEIYRGFWMIRWFREEFAHLEVEQAAQLERAPEEILDKYLQDIPAGSLGLMMLPYWGAPLLEPAAKGAFIGFGDVHSRGYLYKSVIEGLCYGLRAGLERISEVTGKKENIFVSGGASRSNQICQIAADIFGKPVIRGKSHESCLMGAAIAVAAGTGLHPDWEFAVKVMTSQRSCIEPNLANHSIYDDYFNNVYKKAIKLMKPLSEEIRRISNYPEIV